MIKVMHYGKMIKGKTRIIPNFNFYAGMLCINWLRYSFVFRIPKFVRDFLEYFGVNTIGV